MFERNTIIAIVLVVLIIVFLPKYINLINPPKPLPVQTTEAQKPAPADTTAGTAPIAKSPDTTATPPNTEHGLLAADTLPIVPEFVTVQTPLYEMALGSNAEVSRYELKKYELKDGEPVDLHKASAQTNPALGVVDFNLGGNNPHSLKDLRFKASKTRITLSDGGTDSVTFVTGDSTGPQIRLTYIFVGNQYGFGLALHTENLAPPETGEFNAMWNGGVPVTEPDPSKDLQYSAAYAKVGDEVVTVKVGKDPRKEFTASGQTGFVAVRSKYFIAALIPFRPAAGTEILGRNPVVHDKNTAPLYNTTLRQTWGQNASGRWMVYWGPIKFEYLKAMNAGLEETMTWGWQIIKPISRVVLWALIGLHSVISNYGIVIIIFSVVVKLLLWPLTRKSQISMKKMSALQPEITQLRETHKNNPQAMNAAIMKLYKDRGVNPASGCLMMLPQMPVLYALYAVFSTTIEFRQAPFFAWIQDLSQPDIIATLPFSLPLYGAHVAILPLIMGVTQFFMAKRTSTDPNQKMMLYIMPVFMTLIFNNFPSGLTLYWTLFNVWALVEQNLIKIPDFTPSVQVMDEPKKKAGNRK